MTGSAYQIGSNLFAFGSAANWNSFLGFAGNTATTGQHDTGTGALALLANSTGGDDTAAGFEALAANTSGNDNTATGSRALNLNTTGSENTATGFGALKGNILGNGNTATGFQALGGGNSGDSNTAEGTDALFANTTGTENTAIGASALIANSSGSLNTALGGEALLDNTTGSNNVAIGAGALGQDPTGSGNIALGWEAGVNVTSGSNNIYIGNPGVSSESNAIRIGNGDVGGHTAFYVAAVLGYTVPNGTEVFIGSNAQLGTITSSRRYKDDIQDMGEASDALMKLRPVTFRYKQAAPDGSKPLQYGLIAEEVADVFPEAVLYDDKGEPNSVQYHKINAMLLNEVQKQRREIDELKASLETLKSLLAKDAGR